MSGVGRSLSLQSCCKTVQYFHRKRWKPAVASTSQVTKYRVGSWLLTTFRGFMAGNVCGGRSGKPIVEAVDKRIQGIFCDKSTEIHTNLLKNL